jgi:hydroxymethylpyrimidine pyrophosphatase-like HAD family hydrolase
MNAAMQPQSPLSISHPPSSQRLRPLSALSANALRNIDYLLFDVDETFTTHGLLTSEAYASLFALRDAGITAIPVTGRPSGWGNVMLSTWPIKACVTENGGVMSWRDAHNVHHAHRGAAYIETLRALGERIVARYPMVRISADQPYRLTDLAIDYAEQSSDVSEEAIVGIVAMMRADGYLTAVSSIHIHAYFPVNEKADGVYPLMHTAFAMTSDDVHQRCAFIGDSPNDASLFASIPLSVGVANVRAALDKIHTAPAYICTQSCGAGFIEFAQQLIAAKR